MKQVPWMILAISGICLAINLEERPELSKSVDSISPPTSHDSSVTDSGVESPLEQDADSSLVDMLTVGDSVPLSEKSMNRPADTVSKTPIRKRLHIMMPPDSGTSIETITFIDGQSLTGKVVKDTSGILTIMVMDSGYITIDQRLIQTRKVEKRVSISRTGKIGHKDPNRTRYLYSPTAFSLKKGDYSFSQKQLFFSSGGIGVTDNISLQLGAVMPFWFVENGFNIILGGKIASQVYSNIHVAGGFQTFLVPEFEEQLGVPFGTVTVGNYNAHASLNASVPFDITGKENQFGDRFTFSLSGLARLSNKFAILSENILFVEENDIVRIFSIAGRILGKNLSTDIGILVVNDLEIPLPWLDITYHW